RSKRSGTPHASTSTCGELRRPPPAPGSASRRSGPGSTTHRTRRTPPPGARCVPTAETLTRIEQPWDPETLFADERSLPLPPSSSIDEILDAHPWLRHTRGRGGAE